MTCYYIDGTGGPVVTASNLEVFAALWNPHASRRIKVVSVGLLMRDFDIAGNGLILYRTSTRGTPGSTVTPDADNCEDGLSPPPSGMLLDLAEYSVQPTLAAAPLFGPFAFPAGAAGTEGSGFVQPLPRGVIVKPGTGLAICERIGSTFSGSWDVNFAAED